jgi:Fe-Mn family superoxide dismutase
MYILPELTYDYGALSPYIGEETTRIHHDKHHQAYVDKLNAALADNLDLRDIPLAELLSRSDIPAVIRNNGGGHYNHSLFWQWMSPTGGGEPEGELAAAIKQYFGSFQAFVEQFNEKALGVFGSGWVWLLPTMEIITTSNQDTPMLLGKAEPILGLDVWEHAYYLDHQNVRADYTVAWWNVVNWTFVSQRFRTFTAEG